MFVGPADVLAYLGRSEAGPQDVGLEVHLDTAHHMVKAYTRGRGFTLDEPNEPLAAVIVSVAARLHNNPAMNRGEKAGDFAVERFVFHGWTLGELAILNTYRARAR